jgi:hypothetical protein
MPPPLAELYLGPRQRQPGADNEADRRLLEPAVAQSPPLGAVEEVSHRRHTGTSLAPQVVQAPAQVWTPDRPDAFGSVERRLELCCAELPCDVEQRSRGRRAGDETARLDVCGAQFEAAVNPPRNDPRSTVAGHRHFDSTSVDAIESPQGGCRHVRCHRIAAGRQHCGQDSLLPRRRVRSMANDSAGDMDQHAMGDQRAPPLAAEAESIELADGEEAERLRGPFGDGPVEVTGHAAAR